MSAMYPDAIPGVALRTGRPKPAKARKAAALLNAALGDGFSADTLRAVKADGGILVRAVEDGKLLGAATAHVLDEARISRLETRLLAAGVHDVALRGHRVGELKSAAVTRAARGRGIGTAMMQTRLAFLRSAGCRYVAVASWVSADPGHSSLRMLERAGFAPLATIRGYWAQGKFSEFPCPDCALACICTAVILILDLDPEHP
ncbi:MAG TPA: GNAT family N-acetyltransferase [Arthrobacter sp.]